ncbi:STAS domain-containing protein [Amycolatopsis dendrobii]|uniref:STAS domain-containing protein n=1 Tax=Amycolatopsis dendrobii TaxID=2760662 RepID=A0A7W3Z809_9PSEU|nr:STAS domain-containing protein [Amycolatopsis dendrobii]MBB1151856.1 STAS domain-containing protein [Amycolatopsis dendrobii]
MTPPSPLACTWTTPRPRTVRLTVRGELDYDSQHLLVRTAREMLAAHPECRSVRLDCGELGFCDSSGLAGLLMVSRLVRSAGASLYLDNRSAELDRLLRRTNLLDHFTAPTAETTHRRQDS